MFSPTGSIYVAPAGKTQTLLNSGKVLIAGGEFTCGQFVSCATAEATLYDPTTGTFTPTGSLNIARESHTATMLDSGNVLIAGGYAPVTGNPYVNMDIFNEAELYDPHTETFTFTGSMHDARYQHTATLMNDGLVLVAGGGDLVEVEFNRFVQGTLDSAELYDPTTGKFTYTGQLHTALAGQTATMLNDGQVLVAGGSSDAVPQPGAAELYDPASGSFNDTDSLCVNYQYDSSSILNDGTVLLTGSISPIAEFYDPTSGLFTPRSILTPLIGGGSTRLNNGNVLLLGFRDSSLDVGSELYLAGTLSPKGLVSIAVSPATPTLSVGGALQFVATGTFSDNSTQILQSVIWSSSNQAVATANNDASNHGVAFAVGAGTSLITATAGSIAGSTLLTVQ
jgi:hypothetical protein